MIRIRMSRFLTSITALLMSSACGPGKPAMKTLPVWTLQEAWRVGGEAEGPHSFDANFGLGMLPGDTLVHFDYQDERFHLLDRNGSPVRSFGRKGAGPGDLSDGMGFVVTRSGVIVVNDRGNQRLSRFDASGTALGSVPLPPRFTMGVRWDARLLDDGRLLERYATIVDSLSHDTVAWVDHARLWSADLTSSEELNTGSCMVSPRPAGGHTIRMLTAGGSVVARMLPIPYSGAWFATAVDPAGFVWGQPARDSAELRKFPIGQCTASATLPLSADTPTIPQTVRDSAHEVLARVAAAGGGALPNDLNLPDRYPPFFTLHVDDQHRLWVQKFGAAGQQVVDVFDSTGQAIARVDSFPLNARGPLLFRGGRIYGFVTDPDGIKYLVALDIVR